MTNETGRKMKSAEPSAPVEILGMDSVPEAGEHFYVMDASRARNIAELHASRAKEEEQRSVQKVTLDNIFEKIKEGEMKQLDIIVKRMSKDLWKRWSSLSWVLRVMRSG